MDSDAPPFERAPHVIGGRYGLSSKEFRPAHVKAVFDELALLRRSGGTAPEAAVHGRHPRRRHPTQPRRRRRPSAYQRPAGEVQAMFYGLGADGTVGANKASVKIIGEHTDLFAQGYFVYDSKKSGSVTVSHLRFGPEPIRSTYLIEDADFVACHQFGLLEKMPVLDRAKPGATFLLNSPYGPDELWDRLPVGGAGPDHRQGARRLDDRRPPGGQGERARRPDQHGDAAVLLRPGRRHPDRGGDRPHQGVRRGRLRAARRSDRRAQLRRDRRFACGAGPRRRARRRRRSQRRLEHVLPAGAPDFVDPGHGPPDGRRRRPAARSRRSRSTARSRRARRSTRSEPSPRRSRSGTPTSASTAASAPSSARTRRSG